jgi:hypothetical protein
MAAAPALILFKTFRDPWEAYFLRGRLEAEGVPVFVFNDQHIYVDWLIATALGGVRIMVPTPLAGEAQAVWEGIADGDYQALLVSLFGDTEALRCPRCSAADIRRGASVGEIVFGVCLLALTGVPIKFARTRCTCRVCGATWNEA